jgi:muconolactone delta-isomerase
MKFLFIGETRDVGIALPPALIRQLLEATVAAMNQLKKEGKILEVYFIPGAASFVTLGEFKTAEEMVKNFNMMPFATYMNFEIHPLADFNESMKIIIEKLKQAEKMMAGAPK